jgi:hypothetical protein
MNGGNPVNIKPTNFELLIIEPFTKNDNYCIGLSLWGNTAVFPIVSQQDNAHNNMINDNSSCTRSKSNLSFTAPYKRILNM